MQINHTPKNSHGAGDAKLGLKHKMLALRSPTNQRKPQQYSILRKDWHMWLKINGAIVKFLWVYSLYLNSATEEYSPSSSNLAALCHLPAHQCCMHLNNTNNRKVS